MDSARSARRGGNRSGSGLRAGIGAGALLIAAAACSGDDSSREASGDSRETEQTAESQPPGVNVDEPELTAASRDAADGEVVSLEGRGFGAGDWVEVRQCVADGSDSVEAPCDLARASRTRADETGAVVLEVPVYREILRYEGWEPCDPCVLAADTAGAEINIGETSEPLLPEVTFAEADVALGDSVTLIGTGFGNDNPGVRIELCAFPASFSPESPQSAANEGMPCILATGTPGQGIAIDSSGSFELEELALPAALPDPDGEDLCVQDDLRCGLAWIPTEGAPPVFATFME